MSGRLACCCSKKNRVESLDIAAKYKLTYFDLRDRGELTRLIFAQAGVNYHDNRIQISDWPELKTSTPWGALPILETDDGHVIGQSIAIARFVAQRHGLAGNDPIQRATADSAVDAITDMYAGLIKGMLMSNENEKTKYMQKYAAEQLPPMLSSLEKFLTANGGGDGYLVGKNLTWADLCAFHLCDQMTNSLGLGKTLEAYPKLQAHQQRVAALPNIAAWLVKRPNNKF